MADAGAETPMDEDRRSPAGGRAVLTAGFYWAKGNVTLMDGKFAVADKSVRASDSVSVGAANTACRSDGGSIAPERPISPEAVQVALADIPYRQPEYQDPWCDDRCRAALRRLMWKLLCLYDREDHVNQHVLDGITGMGYLSSDYFMPFCGALELASGQISGKCRFAADIGDWAPIMRVKV